MIEFNYGNILAIENDEMTLDIENNGEEGITMTLTVPKAYITMIGILQPKELRLLEKEDFDNMEVKINNKKKVSVQGAKKVLATMFSTQSIKDKNEKDYKMMFQSEDTTIWFHFTGDEWNEVITYFLRNSKK